MTAAHAPSYQVTGKCPAPKRQMAPTDNYIVVSCIGIAVSFLIQEEQNTLATKRL